MKDFKQIKETVSSLQGQVMSDVEITPKNLFNQFKLTTIIELYTHSKYETLSPREAEARGIVFRNIINPQITNAIRKTNLDEKSITLEVKSQITKYLATVANKEFMDDEFMGEKLNKLVLQYYKFGTVILLVDRLAPKGNRVKVIPFNKIMWDVNDYKKAPVVVTDVTTFRAVVDNPKLETKTIDEWVQKNNIKTDNIKEVKVFNVYD
jgi:hypothetical protein